MMPIGTARHVSGLLRRRLDRSRCLDDGRACIPVVIASRVRRLLGSDRSRPKQRPNIIEGRYQSIYVGDVHAKRSTTQRAGPQRQHYGAAVAVETDPHRTAVTAGIDEHVAQARQRK